MTTTIPVDVTAPYPNLLNGKQAADEPTFSVDWTDWIAAHTTSATISTSTWTVHADDDDGGLVLTSPLIQGLKTLVSITAGTVGQSYRFTNAVTLSDGQKVNPVFQITVRDVSKWSLEEAA